MNDTDPFDFPLGDDVGSVWLNDLFELSRAPGTPEELTSEANVVAAMSSTIAQPSLLVALDVTRRHRFSKTAVRTAIAAAALLVGTSTAAATGNLPDSAQSAVSRAGSHIGVDIPDPYDEPDDTHDSAASTTTPSTTLSPATTSTSLAALNDPSVAVPASDAQTPLASPSTSPTTAAVEPAPIDSPDESQLAPPGAAGAGPEVTGPAKTGLCRAWAAPGDGSPANQHSTAMRNLQTAAAAASQSVEEFCADTLIPGATELVTTTSVAAPTTAVADQGNQRKATQGDENVNTNPEKEEKKPKGTG